MYCLVLSQSLPPMCVSVSPHSPHPACSLALSPRTAHLLWGGQLPRHRDIRAAAGEAHVERPRPPSHPDSEPGCGCLPVRPQVPAAPANGWTALRGHRGGLTPRARPPWAPDPGKPCELTNPCWLRNCQVRARLLHGDRRPTHAPPAESFPEEADRTRRHTHRTLVGAVGLYTAVPGAHRAEGGT